MGIDADTAVKDASRLEDRASAVSRVALVTGGAAGIGATIAEKLARAGHRVALADFNQAMMDQTCERLTGIGGTSMGVFADLKSNPLALIEMARAGVIVDVIRNGHSQIKQSMLDDVTRFGTVEESAHFYEAFTDDSQGRYCTENTL